MRKFEIDEAGNAYAVYEGITPKNSVEYKVYGDKKMEVVFDKGFFPEYLMYSAITQFKGHPDFAYELVEIIYDHPYNQSTEVSLLWTKWCGKHVFHLATHLSTELKELLNVTTA